MSTVIFNVSLFTFVIIGFIILLIARKMDKMPSFRRLPGSLEDGARHILILIVIFISAFSFDVFSRHEYRICVLALCLFPVTLIHSTFGQRSIKRDMDKAEQTSDAGRMLKYSRVLSRACFASYLVYIPFTRSYLQII